MFDEPGRFITYIYAYNKNGSRSCCGHAVNDAENNYKISFSVNLNKPEIVDFVPKNYLSETVLFSFFSYTRKGNRIITDENSVITAALKDGFLRSDINVKDFNDGFFLTDGKLLLMSDYSDKSPSKDIIAELVSKITPITGIHEGIDTVKTVVSSENTSGLQTAHNISTKTPDKAKTTYTVLENSAPVNSENASIPAAASEPSSAVSYVASKDAGTPAAASEPSSPISYVASKDVSTPAAASEVSSSVSYVASKNASTPAAASEPSSLVSYVASKDASTPAAAAETSSPVNYVASKDVSTPAAASDTSALYKTDTIRPSQSNSTLTVQNQEDVLYPTGTSKNTVYEIQKAAAALQNIMSGKIPDLQHKQLEDNPQARYLLNNGIRYYPFKDGEFSECVRIKPQDIGKLPMDLWHLGNNSFLMHSFHLHKHLLFAKRINRMKREYLIMLPGTYCMREKQMANMYGFRQFKTVMCTEPKNGDFGYWYILLNL